MGKFDGVLDEVYGKQNTKLTSVLDEIYGPEVEPVTMVENEPTPIADMMVGLNRGIESAGEAITSPIQKLFTAPPNQDVVVPEELDLGSMQAVRDRQAMLPPSMPAEPGYVPPAGITEGLEAALPIAYQATKKGISGAIEAAAENIPVTSFPTAPIAEYMQGVGKGAQAEIEKIMQEKQIRPGTISGVATDVGATVLQFAPILGASIISPALATYGLGLLATISGGDKYQKAKQAGFTEEQALAQGIAYGVAEVVGEKIGLDALLSAYKNPAVRQSVTGFIKQVAKQAGIGAGEEGVTQIMQNAIDITAKKVNPYTAGEAPAITQDVLYSAGVGAIGQGVVGGGLGALQSIIGSQQQPQPEAPKEEVQPESPTATEPPPQNMEATTEFLTRKPTVIFGEAERLKGEEVPTGGMTINRQARPTVTFGGEGERTGEAIPEGKGMTIQPTAPSNKLDQLFKREPQKVEPKTYRSNVWEDMTTEELYDEYERVKREEKINDKKILGDKYNQWRRGDSDVKERIETELGLTEEQKNQLYGIGLPDTIKTSEELNEMFETAQQPNFASTPQELGLLVTNSLIKSNNLKGKPFGEMSTSEQGHYLAVKNAFQIMQDKGWNPKEVINAAAQKIARDTGGAHNVPELLDNFIKREPSKTSPQPQQATEVAPKGIDALVVKQPAPKTPQFDFSQETDINKLRTMLDDAVEREDFKPGAESDAILKRIDELENQAIDQVSPELLRRIQDNGVSPEASQRILEKAFLIKKDSIINNPKRMDALLNEYSGIESVVKKTAKIILDDYVKQNFPKADVDGLFSNASPLPREMQTKIIKDAQAKAKAIHGSVKNYFENPVEERTAEPAEPTAVKTPEVQPRPKSGPGMFGGATVQNMYEEIAPKIKRGLDIFKKGKQAYAKNMRNADPTRDKGRVISITEIDGRPVEDEPPIRPRIGLFNLQNVYEALTRPMKRRAEDKRFKEHLDRTMAAGPRQRIEEARGIDKLSFMDKARKAITRAKELATRKFPDLDEKQFPKFANKLRVLDGGKDYADGMAGYIVGETIKDLSPEEYNVFGISLILEDLQKGLDTGLYTNDLPFGYDAQSLAADRQAINPAELRKAGFNEKANRIEEAIKRRNDFMREVKQEAVDNGLLPEAVMNDDRYFHHQVLQYMNMQDDVKTGGKKDVRLGKKGYRMSRTGSLLDFNSEYAQAEFEVLSQMIEDNKRAEFLKYVESLDITPNLRAEAQAQGLPTDAKTLKELRPEGYVEWQPAKGNNFYKVFTIPERIVEEIISKGDAVDVSMDDINEALAVGGPKKTLVIPEGLVKTLDNFKTPRNDGALGKLGNAINKIWKTSMLFMPSRVTNYMVTNAFGDTDVVLAYQPKILGELPSAIKELKANDRKNNKDLEKAYKEQVIGANITEKEIQNIDYESINKPFNIMRYLKNPLNIGKDYLQKAVRINAFRENALRYAAYKYFLSELRAGKKNIYAASDRTKIDGITDMEEKAATLARDLMGDYGNVSALGEEIARKVIPFYRWMEINTPRYYRLLKNASNEGGYEGAIKGGYKTLKRFVQMNIVGTILYQLYHAAIGAVSGDDELEKARDVTKARGQLHSLLPNWLIGDEKKDIVRTVRTQGAWSDVTETLIGTSDLFSDVVDVAAGKTKFKDKMKELGWKFDTAADILNLPPIRKYSMAALPLARTAAEVLTGRASTRSLMETRPIRDRMQHFARAMALGAPYNLAADKPGPERGISDIVTYKTNLGEVAYNEITRKKYEFLRERGYPLPSASESPSGTAYYNLKQAVKFGDKKQIRKYFKEYNQERRKLGKDAADWYDVKERIKESADPSSFMKEELWDEFRKTLNNEEKRKLKTAMRWFKETYK